MLVSGYGELPCPVEDKFIVVPRPCEVVVLGILDEVAGPHIVDSEPEDLHAEQEWVLIATGIADGCGLCEFQDS